MDGWMDGWMDGRTDGRTDGRIPEVWVNDCRGRVGVELNGDDVGVDFKRLGLLLSDVFEPSCW